MNIPKLSVHRSVTVLMIIAMIVVIGTISFTRLGLDLMPEITYPIVSVLIGYPGVSPEDVEELITRPVEEVVATVKGVKKLTSISQEGLGAIMVEFEWGSNLDTGAQDIRDGIDMMRDFLPEEMESPIVLKFDLTMMPIVMYGVSGGEKRSPQSLRTVAKEMIKDRLEQVDGVASCMLWGGQIQEILVDADQRKLDAFGVSLDMLTAKLRAENLNLPGGYVQEKHTEYIIRTTGEYQNLDQIRTTLITMRNGVPIYLKDVAKVIDTVKEERSYVRSNARGSVMLIVMKESGANTVLVSKKIEKEMKKIKASLPADVRMATSFDQAEFINRIINVTGSNAVQGGLLAILVLYYFLRNLRPTLTIGLSIPLSLLATFIPLYFLGQTLNFVTMIGIALGVGMLVDNSIVVIENIYRHFTLGEDRINASIKGASEVAMAITASTLTTVVVFLPLVFAKGITGKLFQGLSMSISFSLVASLFVALTIVPMITSKIFVPRDAGAGQSTLKEQKILHFLRKNYSMVMRWCLTHKRRLALIVAGVFILTVLSAVFLIGKEFFPAIDNNMAVINIKMPVGTVLEETDRVARYMEGILLKDRNIDNVMTIVGLSEGGKQDAAFGTGPTGPNEALLYVRLKEKKERTQSIQQLFDTLRSLLPSIEGATIELMDMGKAMMTGGGQGQKPVSIKIFGKDLGMLKSIAHTVRSIMENVRGVSDVSLSLKEGKPEMHININKERASRFGLTSQYISQYISSAVQGRVATRYRFRGDEFDVRVRLNEKDRHSIANIKNLNLPVAQGGPLLFVPVKDICSFSFQSGPIKLDRENQKRLITVSANMEGRSLGSIVSEIKREINRMGMPDGYFIEFGGEAEQMQETFTDLGLVFILALVLIYMVMAAQLESLMHPFVIMFTVPFSMIGVVLAFLLSGKTISVPAGMGGLILSGIIVNNGIVLVDYINQLRRTGMEKSEAIIEAGVTRLRPVLMTALTTICGMIPLALSKTEGSEMRSVVAVAIIGGVFVGTFLTLLLLPVVYDVFDGIGIKIRTKLAFIVRKEK